MVSSGSPIEEEVGEGRQRGRSRRREEGREEGEWWRWEEGEWWRWERRESGGGEINREIAETNKRHLSGYSCLHI